MSLGIKMLDGNVNLADLTFAREYRGRNNYKAAACVAAKRIADDVGDALLLKETFCS